MVSAAHTPNHLVDQYQTHLKFNGRTPAALQELLVAKADYEHSRRLAEIKALAPKLAQMDAFLPALAERGVRLSYRDISTWDSGKTMRLAPPLFERDEKLLAALIELGFKEVERKDSGREQTVMLKHGRSLVVSIDVKKTPVAAVAETAGVPS